MAPETLARFGDELRVAYRLTLQRFSTLQVQGSEDGRRTLGQLRGHLFERGEPTPAGARAALALLATTDLRRSLANRAPALVIARRAGHAGAARRDAGACRGAARATHAAIAGAAHAPFLSHPAPFLDALRAFADG